MRAHVVRIACTPCAGAAASLLQQSLAPARMCSSLCSLFLADIRPVQPALPSLSDISLLAQSATGPHIPTQPASVSEQAHSHSQLSGFPSLAFMPLMPAQAQAALRTQEVQQLACLEGVAMEQQGKRNTLDCYACELGSSAPQICKWQCRSSGRHRVRRYALCYQANLPA